MYVDNFIIYECINNEMDMQGVKMLNVSNYEKILGVLIDDN